VAKVHSGEEILLKPQPAE